MKDSQEFIVCRVCERQAVDRHEIWGGRHRQKSIKYKLQISLCRNCHNMAHGKSGDTIDLMENGKRMRQKKIKKLFCDIIDIPYQRVLLWLNIYGKISQECLKTIVKRV